MLFRSGMMCPHCEARVKSVLEAVDGVESAVVSHKDGTAIISGVALDTEALIGVVANAGYKAEA